MPSDFQHPTRERAEILQARIERLESWRARGVRQLPVVALLHAQDGEILIVSEVFEKALGLTMAELPTYGDWVARCFPRERLPSPQEVRSLFRLEERWDDGTVTLRPEKGTARLWTLAHQPFGRTADGRSLVLTTALAADDPLEDTSRRLHSERLESLGLMAGGIAHDFNNMLVGILGAAGMALLELPPGDPARGTLQRIETTARRAAELTKQLLAYSGKGKFVVEDIDLSSLVRDMEALLELSRSKKAEYTEELAAKLPAVRVDSSQVRQIVLNLVVNASDALADGAGRIAVRTGVWEADETAILRAALPPEDARPGWYAFVEVKDSGAGMTPETMERMFDPFFTTKPQKGHGLGLSAVLGVVRSHQGLIHVHSAPARGTTIRVSFPALSTPAVVADPESGVETIERMPVLGQKRKGMALLVEDEEVVRDVTRDMLTFFGYDVVEAADGREGVDLFVEHMGSVNLVLLDLSMPRMDGGEAFLEMRRLDASVPIILMSGYNETKAGEFFKTRGLAGFLYKPFMPTDLKDLLDQIRR
ncbi:MAG: response regulator [Sumerlaeia bacterium]